MHQDMPLQTGFNNTICNNTVNITIEIFPKISLNLHKTTLYETTINKIITPVILCVYYMCLYIRYLLRTR